MNTIYRFRQGIAGFNPVLPKTLATDLGRALTLDQIDAFRQLSRYDQRHLHQVYRFARNSDPTNPDLHVAALLHDIGKAALGGKVTLVDRTINVILGKISPRLLIRLAELPAPRWRRGIALAVHHPALGADWAAELGCNNRVCWLIRHHADSPAPDDIALLLLMHADRTV